MPTILAAEGASVKAFEATGFASQRPAVETLRHAATVHNGDISTDLRFVVTGSADEYVKLAELSDGHTAIPRWSYQQPHRVSTVSFGAGGVVFSGGYDWLIRSRQVRDGSLLAEAGNDSGRVGTVCVSPSGLMLAVANADGSALSIWSNTLKRVGAPFHFPLQPIKAPMAFSAGDRFLALPEERRGVVILRLSDMTRAWPEDSFRITLSGEHFLSGEHVPMVDRIPTNGQAVSALSFGHRSDLLAIAAGSVTKLVRPGIRKVVAEWETPGATCLTFSQQDTLLGVGTSDCILVIDLRTGRELHRIPATSPLLCLRFSEDDTRIGFIDNGSSTGYAPQCGVFRFEGAVGL
jgi:WD40 repeat protein